MDILATLDIQSLLFLLVPYKQEAVQYSKVTSKCSNLTASLYPSQYCYYQ